MSSRFAACSNRMIEAVIRNADELSYRLGYRPSAVDKQ
jgi:hypothetical protein